MARLPNGDIGFLAVTKGCLRAAFYMRLAYMKKRGRRRLRRHIRRRRETHSVHPSRLNRKRAANFTIFQILAFLRIPTV